MLHVKSRTVVAEVLAFQTYSAAWALLDAADCRGAVCYLAVDIRQGRGDTGWPVTGISRGISRSRMPDTQEGRTWTSTSPT